jgi:hypothetical protein
MCRNPGWWTWFSRHRRCPTKKALINYIKLHDGFVVYHGCRPAAVDCYYNNGLRTSDLNHLNKIARSILRTEEFPEITDATFCAAVDSVMERSNAAMENGQLHVALDDRHLLDFCGQYMIYGSEHVGAIAAALARGGGRDYHDVLKRFGIPTILRISLLMQSLDSGVVESLAEYFRQFIWERRKAPVLPCFSWTFTLRSPILPERILGHCHPLEIPDPLHYGLPYRYTET